MLFYDGPDNPAIPDDALDRGVELWRLAEEAVKDDRAFAYNVRMSKLSFDCMRLWRLAKRTNLSTDEVRALARSIVARLDETKTIRLSESPRKSAELEREFRDLAENGSSARQGMSHFSGMSRHGQLDGGAISQISNRRRLERLGGGRDGGLNA